MLCCWVHRCHGVSVSVCESDHPSRPLSLARVHRSCWGDPQRSAVVLYLLLLSPLLLASLLGGWAGLKEVWVGGLLAS